MKLHQIKMISKQINRSQLHFYYSFTFVQTQLSEKFAYQLPKFNTIQFLQIMIPDKSILKEQLLSQLFVIKHVPYFKNLQINISVFYYIIQGYNTQSGIKTLNSWGTIMFPFKQLLLFTLFFIFCHAIINPIAIENAGEILVTDKIAPLLNTCYLETFNGTIQSSYHGIIWGTGLRAFVAMPVRLNHKSCPTQINVIFKIDTGAPISTLTKEVVQKLFQNCQRIEKTFSETYTVKIGGRQIQVSQSQAYYANLNILGANFMRQVNGRLQVNYSKDLPETVLIEFDMNMPQDEVTDL